MLGTDEPIVRPLDAGPCGMVFAAHYQHAHTAPFETEAEVIIIDQFKILSGTTVVIVCYKTGVSHGCPTQRTNLGSADGR